MTGAAHLILGGDGFIGLHVALRLAQAGQIHNICDLVAYSDGDQDLPAIAERSRVPMWDLTDLAKKMRAASVLENCDTQK